MIGCLKENENFALLILNLTIDVFKTGRVGQDKNVSLKFCMAKRVLNVTSKILSF